MKQTQKLKTWLLRVYYSSMPQAVCKLSCLKINRVREEKRYINNFMEINYIEPKTLESKLPGLAAWAK